MTTKLAVAVAVGIDATTVTLKSAGILTRDNVRGLGAVAPRAQRVLAAGAGVGTLGPRYVNFHRGPGAHVP